MEKEKTHIVVIAGEASGDTHAAHLIEAIKAVAPTIEFSGLGGERMRHCGVKIYYDLTRFAVIGFWEVLKHYSTLKQIFHATIKQIVQLRPACVILVDYPGFNLRLAKELKKRRIRVIYYISPQVWAWKKGRVHRIKKCVDRMLVIFKFEKDFYTKYGYDVCYVGHPLLDAIKITCPKEEFLAKYELKDFRVTIGLLPGSREKEVSRLLPVMLKAATILKKQYPMLQFLIAKAPTIDMALINEQLKKHTVPVAVVEYDHYNAINACDHCIVASGTATLETALLQKPMVVVYKTSLITWLIAKVFVRIPYIGLVNVVAGKRIVPECIQFQAKAQRIAQELESIFKDEIRIAKIKSELAQLKKSLDLGGASDRAAAEVLKTIKVA